MSKRCKMCNFSLKRNYGESFDYFDKRKFCNRNCYHSYSKGENHHNWTGGIKTRPDGYLRYSSNGKYMHRVLMETHLGRKLLETEHVHHIDGDKSNNDNKNLLIVTNSEHRKLEVKKQKRGIDGRFITA